MLDKLKADLTAAMKSKDAVATSTLRMLMADAKKELVAGKEKKDGLTEGEFIGLVQRNVKRRKESIQQYEQHGRQDLADQEKAELAVLEKYLPQQLSAEEVEQLVDQTIAETGAETPRDMGKVMGKIMGQYKGQVDGKLVQQLVSQRLA